MLFDSGVEMRRTFKKNCVNPRRWSVMIRKK